MGEEKLLALHLCLQKTFLEIGKKNKDEFPGFEAKKKRVVFLKIWNWEVAPALITESIRGFWTGVYLTVLDLEFE